LSDDSDGSDIFVYLFLLIVIVLVVIFILVSIISILFAIGVLIGIGTALWAYSKNFYNNIYKKNKLVACITIIGIIAMVACGGVLVKDELKTLHDKAYSSNPTNSNRVSATPTPIPADTVAYVSDMTDPSKTISPIETDKGSCLYKNTLTFPPGYEKHSLELKGVTPVAYIDLTYEAKDITRMKGYTDTNTNRWVEKEISYPDPDACFEILVYDSSGNIAYSTGYGMCEHDSYGTSKKGQIKIYNAGDYTVEMTGKSMEVGIEITETDYNRNAGEN